MTRRTSIIEQVGAFFAANGKVLTADEYKNADGAPVRFQLIKRHIGSWSRLLNMIGDFKQYDPANVPVKATVEVVEEAPVEEASAVEEPTAEPAPAPVAEKKK